MQRFASPHASLPDIVAKIREAGRIAVLTGAGISTESGIPDFRSPGGLYSRIDPMEYLSVDALERRPRQFWKLFVEIMIPILDCKPNAGHLALARMEKAGFIHTLVTQNIDGLHTKAGSKNVIELHGHMRTVRCSRCGDSSPMDYAVMQMSHADLPECPECGAMLRPDVVLFGDIPFGFDQAVRAVRQTGFLLIVGSSLSVYPANTLTRFASQCAIINRDTSEGDRDAAFVIHAESGKALMELALALGS
jgi:NAD-dependent deacetylase